MSVRMWKESESGNPLAQMFNLALFVFWSMAYGLVDLLAFLRGVTPHRFRPVLNCAW